MKWEPKIKLKTINITVTCLYVLLLIPLLWIAWYNYPSADDFSMGYRAYCEFKASGGNVFAAIWGALYMAWYDYFNWMGYYSSTFFLSVPPSVFDERLYFLGAYIILGALSLGYIYFFRVIFVKLLKRDKTIVNIVTMLTLILTVECMPIGMARVEGIYWYCSAANYTLMYAFGLMFIGLLLSATVETGKKFVYDIVMACFLAIIVGGGNYMTSLSVAIVGAGFAVWIFLRKKDKRLLIPIVINLVAFALSCLAPGNNVRGSSVEGYGVVKTILICIYYVFHYCIDQWTTWAVLLLLLISIPFLWKLTEKCPLTFKYPIPVIFAAYTLMAANVAPPMYTLANIQAGRLQVLFYMQFMLLLVLLLFYMLGWIRMLLGDALKTEGKEKDLLTGHWAKAFLISSALFVLFTILNSKPVPEYFTTGCAIKDLVNGHAAYYRQQNMERRELLLDENNNDVVLSYFEYEPELLFFSDITTDPQDWTNNSMRRYYDKNSVVRTQREQSQ